MVSKFLVANIIQKLELISLDGIYFSRLLFEIQILISFKIPH